METWDALRARRNVRQFSDQPVPDEVLDRILDAGVVTDQDRRADIGGQLADDGEELSFGSGVHAVVDDDRWAGPELGRGQVPGLSGPGRR